MSIQTNVRVKSRKYIISEAGVSASDTFLTALNEKLTQLSVYTTLPSITLEQLGTIFAEKRAR